MLKGKKNNLKRKQASEPDSDILYRFWNYQIKNLRAMTDMLRAVMEKVDKMQEQMSIVSREMKTLRKRRKC